MHRGPRLPAALLPPALLLAALLASIGGVPRDARAEPPAGHDAARSTLVVGVDDRVRVADPSSRPWSAVALLLVQWPSGATEQCTGFLYGQWAVATAAHCVYDPDQGGWAASVLVAPGASEAGTPFGVAHGTLFHAPREWIASEAPAADIAAVILDRPAGEAAGVLPLASEPDEALARAPVSLAGYPGEVAGGAMWEVDGVVRVVSEAYLDLPNDASRGMSGSPLLRRREDGATEVVGVLMAALPYAGLNRALRITPALAERLAAWAEAPAGEGR